MQNNQHNITSILTLEPPPGVVLLSERWTRRGTISEEFRKHTVHHTRILSPCDFNPEACLRSRETKGWDRGAHFHHLGTPLDREAMERPSRLRLS